MEKFNTSELMSYFRSTGTDGQDGETVLVIHNTGMRTLELPIPPDYTLSLLWSTTEGLVKNREQKTIVSISPGESLIFEVR